MTMKRDIADYIIDALVDDSNLTEIVKFVRGSLPGGMVQQHNFPYIEVMVAEESPLAGQEELTGGYYQQIYTGLVMVSVLLTKFAGGDWWEETGERTARVFSYDKVDEFVDAILEELQKCARTSMGDLTDDDGEVVTDFTVTGPRLYGLDQDARTNNWENRGAIPFEVTTARRAADV